MNDRDKLIRERAYQIWQREGHPEGRSSDHWQQAVNEIEREGSGANGEAIAPKMAASRAARSRPATPKKAGATGASPPGTSAPKSPASARPRRKPVPS